MKTHSINMFSLQKARTRACELEKAGVLSRSFINFPGALLNLVGFNLSLLLLLGLL